MAPKRKLAVITGGAEGIGRAYARRMAEDGHDVLVIDRLSAIETLREVEAAGAAFDYIACDLANSEAVMSVAQQVVSRHGGCDILINNAGIGSMRPFDSVSFAMLREIMAVNLEAPFLLARGLVPAMRERKWGRIVNITTGALNNCVGGFVDYLVSKGGLLGLTRGLASELGVDGITVNAIAPGVVRTPMTTGGRDGHAKLPEEVFDAVMAMQAVKRTQMPEDLVGAMSFLASDDSAFVTGQVLYVDGGVIRV